MASHAPGGPPKYWAFISYSHRVTRWAEWLHRGLASYHSPKSLVGTVTARGTIPRRMSPVFRDREELPNACVAYLGSWNLPNAQKPPG
jgi:hypothetical protein